MEELNVVEGINNASTWLANNQDLLINTQSILLPRY